MSLPCPGGLLSRSSRHGCLRAQHSTEQRSASARPPPAARNHLFLEGQLQSAARWRRCWPFAGPPRACSRRGNSSSRPRPACPPACSTSCAKGSLPSRGGCRWSDQAQASWKCVGRCGRRWPVAISGQSPDSSDLRRDQRADDRPRPGRHPTGGPAARAQSGHHATSCSQRRPASVTAARTRVGAARRAIHLMDREGDSYEHYRKGARPPARAGLPHSQRMPRALIVGGEPARRRAAGRVVARHDEAGRDRRANTASGGLVPHPVAHRRVLQGLKTGCAYEVLDGMGTYP